MPIPTGDGATLYVHDGGVVFLEASSTLAANAVGQVYATREDALTRIDPLPVFDLNGSPLPSLKASPLGALAPYMTTVVRGFTSFGSVIEPVYSLEGLFALYDLMAARLAVVEASGGGGSGGGEDPGTGTPSAGDRYPADDRYPS